MPSPRKKLHDARGDDGDHEKEASDNPNAIKCVASLGGSVGNSYKQFAGLVTSDMESTVTCGGKKPRTEVCFSVTLPLGISEKLTHTQQIKFGSRMFCVL